MKKIIFLTFLLLIIGCQQKPAVGDWYEHQGTGERIKIIFIGEGTLANNYCQKSVAEMWKNVPEEKLARASYFISYAEYDSTRECIVWNESTNPFHPRYVIRAEEDFADYKLVELQE